MSRAGRGLLKVQTQSIDECYAGWSGEYGSGCAKAFDVGLLEFLLGVFQVHVDLLDLL
jgi:hypothetical protein